MLLKNLKKLGHTYNLRSKLFSRVLNLRIHWVVFVKNIDGQRKFDKTNQKIRF